MLFIGLDLAWSYKNGSGIAVIDGNRKSGNVVKYDVVHSDKEIIDYIRNSIGKEKALVSIDAPLIVPNKKGRRIAEKKVGEIFRKYDAGAHPANRERLGSWSNGKIRGEELSKLLKKEGFRHDPYIRRYENTKKFFEVYPHPSMVVLFGLKKILRYKAKPKRDYAFRYNEFKKYRRNMSRLIGASPSLTVPKTLLNKKLENLRGRHLKNYEDTMDAVFCAYISYYYWVHPEKCAVLGNMKGGYILTPVIDGILHRTK